MSKYVAFDDDYLAMAEFMGMESNSIAKLIKKCRDYGFIRSDREQEPSNVERAKQSKEIMEKVGQMRLGGACWSLIAKEIGLQISTAKNYMVKYRQAHGLTRVRLAA